MLHRDRGVVAAVSERTRAVMIAHTLGNPFHCGAIEAFCPGLSDEMLTYMVEEIHDAVATAVAATCPRVGSLPPR